MDKSRCFNSNDGDSANSNSVFTIKYTKLRVSIATLSAKDN